MKHRQFLFYLFLIVAVHTACNEEIADHRELKADKTLLSFRQQLQNQEVRTLDTLWSLNGKMMLLTYEKVDTSLPSGKRNIYTAVVDIKDLDSNIDHLSFSHDTIDRIQWSGYGMATLTENYMNVQRQGKSVFTEKNFSLNGQRINVRTLNPIDSTFRRQVLLQRVSPEGDRKIVSYIYYHPYLQKEMLQISIIGVNDSLPEFGNFYVSTSSTWDCVKNIHWKSNTTLMVQADTYCLDHLEKYLNLNRPDLEIEKKAFIPREY